MKYLKSFNESFNEEFDLISDIEDILLPIKDEGFNIDISKNLNSSNDFMESEGELTRFYVEKTVSPLETKPYKPTDTFTDTFEHLVSYLKERGYDYSMELVGDNGGTISENDCVAYSEFEEDDMSVKELLDVAIKAPINYIRFIIYKPE